MKKLWIVAVLGAVCLVAGVVAAKKVPTSKGSGADVNKLATQGADLYATFETSQGTIVAKLFSKETPKTVQNFVALATGAKSWRDPETGEQTKRPLYDGTIFHRVIPEFMIQGGDPLGNGTGGPGYTFEDEVQGKRGFDKPCLLAMANSGPNTNGSQFFITEQATPWLNGHHTVFGEVVKGCELVSKIARVPARGTRPTEPVVLKHLTISPTFSK